MADTGPLFRGEVVVDWDDPHVIRTGPDSFLLVPDEAEPPSEDPFPAGWVDVGYTVED